MLAQLPAAKKPWASRFARLHPKTYLGLHAFVGLLLAATCAWLFYLLADAVPEKGSMVRLDYTIAHWVETRNTEPGEKIFSWITLLGNELLSVILAGVAVWFAGQRAWRHVALIMVASGGGALLNMLLKAGFHRDRPIYSSEFAVSSASFPSGHAMAAVIGYGVIMYLVSEHVADERKRKLLFLVPPFLALLVAFSRVYLNVHFLSDVLAGMAAGGVWLFVCVTGFHFANRRVVGE